LDISSIPAVHFLTPDFGVDDITIVISIS
jgi:hypothetical protein